MSNENFDEVLEKEKQAIDFGRINYIHQHRTFIRLARYMGLTTQERSVYEMLLEIDNISGWKEWILITNPDLQKQAHVANYDSFAAARARLVKKGFIHFISGGTGKPCSYSLVKLYDPVPDYLQGYLDKAIQQEKADKLKMDYDECRYGESIKASIEAYNSGEEPEDNEIVADLHNKNEVKHHNKSGRSTTTKTAHIHKHNKHLEKDTNDEGSAQETASNHSSDSACPQNSCMDPDTMERHAKWFAFHARGNRLTHNEQKNLDYIELHFTKEAIEEAMYKADAKEKRSVGYVRKILENAIGKA